jgi:hypothetical protein
MVKSLPKLVLGICPVCGREGLVEFKGVTGCAFCLRDAIKDASKKGDKK